MDYGEKLIAAYKELHREREVTIVMANARFERRLRERFAQIRREREARPPVEKSAAACA